MRPTIRDLLHLIERSGAPQGDLNHLGRPIAHTPGGLERFWQWFGKSKAVDKAGRPLVLFHGTRHDFRAFNPERANSNTGTGVPHSAFFFSNDVQAAQSYAGQKTHGSYIPNPRQHDEYVRKAVAGDIDGAVADMEQYGVENFKTYSMGGNVVPAYLKMQKPMRVNGQGDHWKEIWYKNQEYTTNDLVELAQDSGYDSLIIKKLQDRQEGSGPPSDIYVVFSPTQIKSAVGNRGGFDPQSHNIDEGDAP